MLRMIEKAPAWGMAACLARSVAGLSLVVGLRHTLASEIRQIGMAMLCSPSAQKRAGLGLGCAGRGWGAEGRERPAAASTATPASPVGERHQRLLRSLAEASASNAT